MYQTGGFWADSDIKREHCYKVIPKEIAQAPREMILHGFDRVYHALGELGYRFMDAGHNAKYVITSDNLLKNNLLNSEEFILE